MTDQQSEAPKPMNPAINAALRIFGNKERKGNGATGPANVGDEQAKRMVAQVVESLTAAAVAAEKHNNAAKERELKRVSLLAEPLILAGYITDSELDAVRSVIDSAVQ